MLNIVILTARPDCDPIVSAVTKSEMGWGASQLNSVAVVKGDPIFLNWPLRTGLRNQTTGAESQYGGPYAWLMNSRKTYNYEVVFWVVYLQSDCDPTPLATTGLPKTHPTSQIELHQMQKGLVFKEWDMLSSS